MARPSASCSSSDNPLRAAVTRVTAGAVVFVDLGGQKFVGGVGNEPAALAGQLEEAHHHQVGFFAGDLGAQGVSWFQVGNTTKTPFTAMAF